MNKIIVVASDIRSTHNVGSILRTADAFAVEKVIVCGYTPYPKLENDTRLPHIADKNTKDIAKTALGAEKTMSVERRDNLRDTIDELKSAGYLILGLEQDISSQRLMDFHTTKDVALIIGEERYGLKKETIEACDAIVELPMLGHKESLNVSIATGICLYQLRYG